MPDLIPVSHDPFNDPPTNLIPIDYDPFENAHGTGPQGNVAGSVASLAQDAGQRAVDWYRSQPSWSDQMHQAMQSGDLEGQISLLGGFAGSTTPRAGIRAYHGSPHDFDAFDISKIGTGEGAQAFGHGLYFAENPQTAQTYRDSLSDMKPRQVGDNPDLTLPSWVANKVASKNPVAINDVRADFQGRLAEMQRQLADPNTIQPWNIESNIPGIQTILTALDHIEKGAEIKPAGRMYEVNIAADPEHFLDWDKPLSEQHPEVQAKLSDFSPHMTGAQINESARLVPGAYRDNSVATANLSARGIPGIKYLDQGSRASDAARLDGSIASTRSKIAGIQKEMADNANNPSLLPAYFSSRNGHIASLQADLSRYQEMRAKIPNPTSNYVVFDDKLIDIARKYGLAGLIAGGAAHFSTQLVDHDPFQQ